MKNIFLLLILLLFVNFKKTDIVQTGWSDWEVVNPKYDGIDGRVKRGDFNSYANKYHWEFQFRNRYYKDVKFRYGIGKRSEPCYLNYSKHISASKSSDIGAVLINETNYVSVCVDNVEPE